MIKIGVFLNPPKKAKGRYQSCTQRPSKDNAQVT